MVGGRAGTQSPMIRRPAIAVGSWLDVWMENYAKSNCGHPHSKPRKASSRTTSSRRLAASRCPPCSVITPRASRWTPMSTSPPTRSSRRRKRWGASSPMRYRPFRYPLPLGSAFGSEKSSGRKQQLMQAKRPETLRFRVFLVRREGFEPPAFWSVGCLKGKSESFRLRFVLFTAVRSASFPLFPSSPARFFRILGQKWVKHGAFAPTPTASRRPSRRRRQQDRPRRPHHSCSPAEYR